MVPTVVGLVDGSAALIASGCAVRFELPGIAQNVTLYTMSVWPTLAVYKLTVTLR
jgi:urease beta subunit